MKKTMKRIISTVAAIALVATLVVPVIPAGDSAETYAAVKANKNLLTNPGAENAATGWTMMAGSNAKWFAVAYPNNEGYPAPKSGTHYFVPGVTSYDEMYQDVDITGATGIITFSGWMRDYKVDHGDESALRLEIMNSAGKLLATTVSETVTKTETWTQKSISLIIPKDAAKARAILVAKRNPSSSDKSVCDSYFDDLSLVYTKSKDSAADYTPKKGGFIVKDNASGSIIEVVNGGEDSDEQYGRYRGPIDKKQIKVVIPGEITVNNRKVLITAVSSGAFKNNTAVKTVKIAATDKTGTAADTSAATATPAPATSTGTAAPSTAAPASSAAPAGTATPDGSVATSSALDLVTPPPAPVRSLVIESKAFSGCTNLKKVTIDSDLTLIGNNAFYKCSKLTKITIPSKVTKIGKKAFFNCTALSTITIKTKKLKTSKVGADAFKGINSKAVIYVPKKKLSAYKKLLKSKGVTLKTQKIKKK